MIQRLLIGFVLLLIWSASSAAWKNPARSPSLTEPMFGTHDYIAYKAYVMAGRPSWVRFNLRSYFIGTEAPDNGMMPADAIDDYPDAVQCHCILFDASGGVTRDRGERQARREFDKAAQALQNGQRRLAAFYAGALAHYVGDLAQFCHVMGTRGFDARLR